MTTTTVVGVRVDEAFIREIDEWRGKQPNPPTRPEAIRRLAIKGLSPEARQRLKEAS